MYRTVSQLDSVMGILAAFFPNLCSRVELPNRSIQGRPIYALRMRAGGGHARRGVLLVGGMHARELMNPDAIVELMLDLALSYLNETGRSYGGASWSALDVKIMLETLDIWILPCANPDGREFVMQQVGGDRMWRQNRRDNPGTPCDGVDLNRNSDVVWGVTGPATSCNPCSSTRSYLGPTPFSEPESKNIEYLCDTHNIKVFADVHSFSEFVLYPWGHAQTQTTDSTKVFTGLATGTCAPLTPAGYKEYMTPRDFSRYRTVSQRVADRIRQVRGRNYVLKSVFEVYNGTTTGSCSDYVYSRHIANASKHKTYGFAFETGPNTGDNLLSFQPTDPEPIKRDAKAGLLALIQQSICAIDFIGTSLFGLSVQSIRTIRDRMLAKTEAGRGWIDLFERVQFPLLGIVLSDKKLTKEAATLVRRVKTLAIQHKKAIVSKEDVERGIAFLDELAKRTTDKKVKIDISTVSRFLKGSGGQDVEKVIAKLGKSKPAPNKK